MVNTASSVLLASRTDSSSRSLCHRTPALHYIPASHNLAVVSAAFVHTAAASVQTQHLVLANAPADTAVAAPEAGSSRGARCSDSSSSSFLGSNCPRGLRPWIFESSDDSLQVSESRPS
jgi:hypothetical protein